MPEPEDRRRDEKDAEREVWCLSNGDRSRLAVAETPEQKSSHHRVCPIQIRISRSPRHGIVMSGRRPLIKGFFCGKAVHRRTRTSGLTRRATVRNTRNPSAARKRNNHQSLRSSRGLRTRVRASGRSPISGVEEGGDCWKSSCALRSARWQGPWCPFRGRFNNPMAGTRERSTRCRDSRTHSWGVQPGRFYGGPKYVIIASMTEITVTFAKPVSCAGAVSSTWSDCGGEALSESEPGGGEALEHLSKGRRR